MKTQDSELRTLDSAELPPHNEDAEWFLLACAIEKPDLLHHLKPHLFYSVEARDYGLDAVIQVCTKIPLPDQISERMFELLTHHKKVFIRLEEARGDLPSSENWPYWLRMLDDLHRARRVLRAKAKLSSAAERMGTGDPSEVIQVEKELRDLGTATAGTDTRSYRDCIPEVIDQIETDYASDGSPRGVATGFPDIDHVLGGLQKGRLIVVGARPSVGKSSLCLAFAEAAALTGVKVLVCSLEMSAQELVSRSTASLSRVNLNSFRTHNPQYRASQGDFQKVIRAVGTLGRMPISIADRISTLSEIVATCHEAIKGGAGLIVIDYLQLIRIPGFKGNRNELVTEISTTLKSIAHLNQVPVVAAAQLGRLSEREKRRPGMSDLRDSGSIEQDADVILLLHADPEQPEPEYGQPTMVEAAVVKNRGGSTGGIQLVFLKHLTRFESVSKIDAADYRHSNPND